MELTLKEFLEYHIISVGKYSLTVIEVIGVLIILAVGYFVNYLVKKILYESKKLDGGSKYAFYQIIHYVLIIIVFALTLRTLGVDISPLLVGSSAILVGIGLGLQGLILDFISGVVILVDRSVRVGDILDVNGVMGKVTEIKMRTTKLVTNDFKTMIFPNSHLTKDKLINYSYENETVIFTVEVGVHYQSDLELIKKLLIESATENPEISTTQKPFVRLENFGDSSLDLKLYFYTATPYRSSQIRSDVRVAILEKFRKNNINIPYPISTLENASILPTGDA